MLDAACEAMSRISDVLPDAEPLTQRLQNAVYELEDCCNEVINMWDAADAEVDNVEEIDDRLDLIHTLGRKYGSTIEEMLDYLEKAKKELEYLERYEENREALIQECEEAHKKADELAAALSEKRRKVAVKFSEAVKAEMTFLDMPNVELVVRQDKCELNNFGCDDIEILISANPGEQPKSVAKIASGGELSRMMLAIKNVLADKDDIDTLIFDEVDTGISGSAAQKVGLKLKEVSKSRQVLCVTHQAQIAALADSHYKIMKQVMELVHLFLQRPDVDPDRVYIYGMSMGGIGAFDAVARHPEIFAAAVPICGDINPDRLGKFEGVSFSLYHGDSDPAVPVSGSRDAYRALKAAGADVRYHEFPGCGHVCWWKAFEMPDFMSWMFSKSKKASAPEGGKPVKQRVRKRR